MLLWIKPLFRNLSFFRFLRNQSSHHAIPGSDQYFFLHREGGKCLTPMFTNITFSHRFHTSS